MIKEELKKRIFPELLVLNNGMPVKDINDWILRWHEIINILCEEIYGRSPLSPEIVMAKTTDCNKDAYAGKAVQSQILLSRYPFYVLIHMPRNISSKGL